MRCSIASDCSDRKKARRRPAGGGIAEGGVRTVLDSSGHADVRSGFSRPNRFRIRGTSDACEQTDCLNETETGVRSLPSARDLSTSRKSPDQCALLRCSYWRQIHG